MRGKPCWLWLSAAISNERNSWPDKRLWAECAQSSAGCREEFTETGQKRWGALAITHQAPLAGVMAQPLRKAHKAHHHFP